MLPKFLALYEKMQADKFKDATDLFMNHWIN
jgi:hypothetical protein